MKRTVNVNVNVKNTRSKKYAAVLQKIQRDKVCPFCTEHFLKYHTRPIIKNSRHWILTENFNPYPGTTHHLLLVSKKHVAHFSELSAAAHAELFAILLPELKKRDIRGGGLFMRFGDSDYNFSSVGHLHAQLLVGVKRGKNTELLLAPLGFKKKSRK
jgi:diadenosine tetraphosphate (Ap4A) HIT family hydrolase